MAGERDFDQNIDFVLNGTQAGPDAGKPTTATGPVEHVPHQPWQPSAANSDGQGVVGETLDKITDRKNKPHIFIK